MYQVKKLQSDFRITEGSKTYYFSGINWGVFDENNNLSYQINQHGDKIYDVYGYKYVAQYQADFLGKGSKE